MGVILNYDYDFFHYSTIIPNLECAKFSAYNKKHRQIITFNPQFQPEKYTKTFFRKEYDDGLYDTSILKPGVEYGGRAFSQIYKPFNYEMEHIIPDFEIYAPYQNYYGTTKLRQTEFKTILNATHVRLSLDGEHLEPFPYNQLRRMHPSVIVHDYDLGILPNAFELLYEVCNSKGNNSYYRIGNKYPINVYTFTELKKWLQLVPMGTCFYLQYNNFFADEEIIDLVHNPALGLRQVIYNFTYNCIDENQFIQDILPGLYKQILYLRRNNKKILLNIDVDFFKTTELFNLMKLLNCFYGKTELQTYMPKERTLYAYCSNKRRAAIEAKPWIHLIVNRQEMRESFQYIRQHNYEVFDMFYSVPGIIDQGGKLVNEWPRDLQ